MMAQQVKKPPAMQKTQEMWVQSLGQEDSLEEERATHSQYSCLENPTDTEGEWATIHGSPRVRHDWAQMGRKWIKNIELG